MTGGPIRPAYGPLPDQTMIETPIPRTVRRRVGVRPGDDLESNRQ